jgi:two-component system, OmpR family, copper resistance phosphate regulon response regulator CusR
MRILLIEDENALGTVVKQGLEATHYHVDWARDGKSGLALAGGDDYDLIVLDLMLPGRDGWSICETLRTRRNRTPILMLSARGDVDDRVRGLELGADDYLPKPFAFNELRARVRALLRRDKVHKGRVIRIADLVIDTEGGRVERSGQEISLTAREYALLEALALREGQVLTREMVMERVWRDQDSYSNTVEVHIGALRRKIDTGHEVKLIHTVHGRGYMLRGPES